MAELFIAALGMGCVIDCRGVADAMGGGGRDGGGGDGVGSGGGDSWMKAIRLAT